jgi:hypothetical protein
MGAATELQLDSVQPYMQCHVITTRHCSLRSGDTSHCTFVLIGPRHLSNLTRHCSLGSVVTQPNPWGQSTQARRHSDLAAQQQVSHRSQAHRRYARSATRTASPSSRKLDLKCDTPAFERNALCAATTRWTARTSCGCAWRKTSWTRCWARGT